MRLRGIAIVLALVFYGCGASQARDDTSGIRSFESCGALHRLEGWSPDSTGALFLDSAVVHQGRYAGRIERGPSTRGEVSSFALVLPVDFSGTVVDVHGWLRLEGVTGYAGIFQRQEARGARLASDNMARRHLSGTSGWAFHDVSLRLDRGARELIVGASLTGQGKVWVDDLKVFVDGRPLAGLAMREPEKTVIDTDHEFDAGSRVASSSVTPDQIENLVTLGKVWGFLKYHHPRVIHGAYHWDYELFRVLPRVLEARDRAAANAAMIGWVDRLGPVPRCGDCAERVDGRPVRPRLDWLGDSKRLGPDLAARLRQIHARRARVDDQFYVGFTPGIGNPEFREECAYPGAALPDAGYRLLALYRFWNIVEYWSAYRDLIEEDWEQVLREFVPRVLADSSVDDYRLTLMALIARVHDSHANLWGSLDVRPPVGNGQLPVHLRFVEGRPVVVGHSDPDLGRKSGLRVGDVLEAIDGARVDTLAARWVPWYAASNDAARSRDIAASLTRGPLGRVRLTIERDGRALSLDAERVPVWALDFRTASRHDHSGDTFRRLSDEVAYLKLSTVKESEVTSYVERATGAKCLVIDIRNYPSEFMVFALGQHLVERTSQFAMFTVGEASNPGAFHWTPPVQIVPRAPRFEGRIAILVDETTQSQAEYTTMAFRCVPGAVVVGSTTAGADGNVSSIPLPGGLRTMISGIGVFYPDHTPTQRVGILPDQVVRPTLAGIRAGKDEVLEAAVRHVLGRALRDDERAALRSNSPIRSGQPAVFLSFGLLFLIAASAWAAGPPTGRRLTR